MTSPTSSSSRRTPMTTTRSSTPRCDRSGSRTSSVRSGCASSSRSSSTPRRRRGRPPDHVLLAGSPGLGKTTLAMIIASELGAPLRITSGPAIERAGDLAALLSTLSEGEVLFLDEIHRMARPAEEMLYVAMEDFRVDVVVGKGPGATAIPLDVAPFTLVGATTQGRDAARARCATGSGSSRAWTSTPPRSSSECCARSATCSGSTSTPEGAEEIGGRARGTPRIANRLLRRVRDFAEVRADGVVTREIARAALAVYEVDELGLDRLDHAVLDALLRRFGGGPVGLTTLAVAVAEEPETVETVAEPFLVRAGSAGPDAARPGGDAGRVGALGLRPPTPAAADAVLATPVRSRRRHVDCDPGRAAQSGRCHADLIDDRTGTRARDLLATDARLPSSGSGASEGSSRDRRSSSSSASSPSSTSCSCVRRAGPAASAAKQRARRGRRRGHHDGRADRHGRRDRRRRRDPRDRPRGATAGTCRPRSCGSSTRPSRSSTTGTTTSTTIEDRASPPTEDRVDMTTPSSLRSSTSRPTAERTDGRGSRTQVETRSVPRARRAGPRRPLPRRVPRARPRPPGSGLDLRGGTEVTLTAHPIAGGTITKVALNQAVNIIRQRANGLGVGGAEVSPRAAQHRRDVPGKGVQVVNTIGQTALLRFRQVLASPVGLPTPATTTSPSPSANSATQPDQEVEHEGAEHHEADGEEDQEVAGPSAELRVDQGQVTPRPSPTATPSPTPDRPHRRPAPRPAPSVDDSGQHRQPAAELAVPDAEPRVPRRRYQNWDCSKPGSATRPGRRQPD